MCMQTTDACQTPPLGKQLIVGPTQILESRADKHQMPLIDLLLCLPLPAMALQVAIVVVLKLVLGCPVRGGNRQVSGHADSLLGLRLLGLAHLLGWGLTNVAWLAWTVLILLLVASGIDCSRVATC